MLRRDEPTEYRQQAIFHLQEISTVLRFLSTEIDAALARSESPDRELLRKVALALKTNHQTLVELTRESVPAPE